MDGPIDELTYRQTRILQLLRENNMLSKRELAIHLNINVPIAHEELEGIGK